MSKDPAIYGSGQPGDSRVVGSDQPATSTEQTHARDLIDQSMLLGRKPEGKLLRAFSTVCTGVYSDGVNEPSSLLSGFHRVFHQSSHREPHASPLYVCQNVCQPRQVGKCTVPCCIQLHGKPKTRRISLLDLTMRQCRLAWSKHNFAKCGFVGGTD